MPSYLYLPLFVTDVVRANPQFHDYTASAFRELVENWLRNASKRLLAEGKKVPRGPQRVPDYV